MAFFALKRNAAPGVDGLTWRYYEAGLEEHLQRLFAQVQSGAYRALPVRRQYIPKPDGKQRPLGGDNCLGRRIDSGFLLPS
jgi:retron-type reverse transcriptase